MNSNHDSPYQQERDGLYTIGQLASIATGVDPWVLGRLENIHAIEKVGHRRRVKYRLIHGEEVFVEAMRRYWDGGEELPRAYREVLIEKGYLPTGLDIPGVIDAMSSIQEEVNNAKALLPEDFLLSTPVGTHLEDMYTTAETIKRMLLRGTQKQAKG